MNHRETNIAAGLLAPEVSSLGLRRVSPASLTMLQMLGNPLAELRLEGSLYFDILQFAWLHSAPREQVRSLVVTESNVPGTVALAVLEWADSLPPDYLVKLTEEMSAEFSRTSAAMALSADSSKSKNGSGPCSPSH